MTYTVAALLGVAGALVVDLWGLRTRLVLRRVWWTAYAIVVFFQLLVNGALTGRGAVRYDPGAILGEAAPRFIGAWRVVYAPVEDLLFGFSLVVQTLAWWVWWGRRSYFRR